MRRCIRIVDEDVEGAAGDFGYLRLALVDAGARGDVERDGAHAQLLELLEDFGAAGGGDDMVVCWSNGLGD